MNGDDIKHALISILIGASVAFFSTLFTGLVQFLQEHATTIVASVGSATAYLASARRA